MEPTQKELARFEALAVQLKADGYNGPVVARKMISEHGMPEAAATALVSRLYGREVDPRKGDTATAVVFGVGVGISLGVIGAGIFWFLGISQISIIVGGPIVMASLGSFGKAFIASMNAGVKEDLRR